MHGVIKCSRKSCLNLYIDMKTELRKNAKNDFEKYFFLKFVNNAVLWKTMESVWKHRHVKLVTKKQKGFI